MNVFLAFVPALVISQKRYIKVMMTWCAWLIYRYEHQWHTTFHATVIHVYVYVWYSVNGQSSPAKDCRLHVEHTGWLWHRRELPISQWLFDALLYIVGVHQRIFDTGIMFQITCKYTY